MTESNSLLLHRRRFLQAGVLGALGLDDYLRLSHAQGAPAGKPQSGAGDDSDYE